jgi:hypothetical protein
MLLPNLDAEAVLRPLGIAVTIYAPLDPAQRDVRLPAGRLDNLLAEAEETLTARGVNRRQRDLILDPARQTVAQLDLRTHREPSLLLLAASGFSRAIFLPERLDECIVVGPRFYVKPLLSLLAHDTRFHLLAISARTVRLLECGTYFANDRTPPDLQKSWEDLANETTFERTVQFSPAARPRGGGPRTMVKGHGYESPNSVWKDLFVGYLRRISSAVEAELANDPWPVVLAADAETTGHFRKLTGLRTLAEQGLILNPHGLEDRELVQRARALLNPPGVVAAAETIERATARLGAGEPSVAIRLDEIVAAACYGRVDSLVVAADELVWGSFDEANGTLIAHSRPEGNDEELLNYAVVETLAKGGSASALPRRELPHHALAVATLRY